MSKFNCNRKGCKDVFKAFLVKNAHYEGVFEFPIIKPTFMVPNKLICFSKAISSKNYNQWVHFYEDDHLFERLWRNPSKYINILKRFRGVILPDFSLYRDMPLVMQLWNIYRSRALGYWLQENGINVIPNIRYGDNRTFKYSCDGISKNSIISIGSYGTLKNTTDRHIFITGLDYIIKKLQPIAIVVYGSTPDNIFRKYAENGIKIYHFESDYAASHKEVV